MYSNSFLAGTKCPEPPKVTTKTKHAPKYFGGTIDPFNGNISLLQTGRMLAHSCPGSNNISSLLPISRPKTDDPCKRNEIRIRKVGQLVRNGKYEITTSTYLLSALNYLKGHGTSYVKDPLKVNTDNSTITLMTLLTFSSDVILKNSSIRSLSGKVNIKSRVLLTFDYKILVATH